MLLPHLLSVILYIIDYQPECAGKWLYDAAYCLWPWCWAWMPQICLGKPRWMSSAAHSPESPCGTSCHQCCHLAQTTNTSSARNTKARSIDCMFYLVNGGGEGGHSLMLHIPNCRAWHGVLDVTVNIPSLWQQWYMKYCILGMTDSHMFHFTWCHPCMYIVAIDTVH